MSKTSNIFLAVIVVLIVILIGAYVFSDGNNTPVTNATATPTLAATPTAVPTVSPTASPSVTATPTITPTATPVPTVSSGVKATKYGYNITYPPITK